MKIQNRKSFLTGLGIGLAIASIPVGVIFWYVKPPPVTPVPTVTITALKCDTNEFTNLESRLPMSREITVIGECTDVPSDQNMWICVLPIDVCRYYPQREPVQPEDIWQISHVGVGKDDPSDIGKQFFVCAVLANADASDILYRYAQEVLTGMESLPPGAVIYDQVLVMRDH